MTPQSSIAHYRIAGKLGEGGMGAVYRATDTKLNRDVAIKVLPDSFAADPDRLARFAREAQVLAALNHPNIAAIYGIEDRALVLELVEGPTLAERIAQGPMPADEALPLIRQLIDGLEYAHEKGVIHRDLKPANLKLTSEGRLKILDFGLAKALSADTAAADPQSSPTLTMRATMAGLIMGTAGYMAPEQARGHIVDKRADIWAFGVVVYEMLTGGQLFTGPTVSDTLAAVLKEEPPWDRVPERWRRLVRACLVRDVRQRVRDIGDARLLLDEPVATPAAAPAAPAPVLRWWIAALGLLALAGLAVAVVHFRETSPPPAPVRFQIPPPEKASFVSTGLAISPDGRRLAFIAAVTSGQPMLWVRPLDSVAAQVLPGTEGASFLPFWSPDSRFIGFLAQGRLKKVEALGGPPQTLCELPGILTGGSWSRDGVILFGTAYTGLFRVSQEGGVPTLLTKLDESHKELAHMRPWFLPDGRHFLYFARTQQLRGGAIYLATLDGQGRKRLVGASQAGAYAPPVPGSRNGHLLFMRDGTLMAQPLDARSFEPAGEPFRVAEQVGSSLAMGLFSVSANGVLAYRTGLSSAGSYLVWFDRGGKSVGTLDQPGVHTDLTLSPDGKYVALEASDQTGNRDIWVLDVARGVRTRFTFDAGRETRPIWSPDGTQLVFASDRAASDIDDIYRKNSSGSGKEELLLKSGGFARPNAWSPDGRYLLYEDRDTKGHKSELWILPVSAGAPGDRKPTPYLQTPFNVSQGQFSPDGRWIAYTSDESASNQVFVQSFPPGAGKFQISTGSGGTQPRWRRDGKEIFYIATDGKLMAVEVKAAPRFEAGPPQALFDPQIAGTETVSYFRYDVAADGKRFLAISLDNSSENKVAEPITLLLNWQAAVKR